MSRVRTEAARRLGRLRRMARPITQCTVATGAAWLVATEVLGHPRPFFAPIAVVISIGVGMGTGRLRRVAELVVGVSVGIGIADLLISWIGGGFWQIGLVVALAMIAAVLVDGGTLLTIQAASSAILVATLLPPTGTGGVNRMLDALVGGVLGLLAVAIFPGHPLRTVRRNARAVFDVLTASLTAAADALDQRDRAVAARALQSMRTQTHVDDYRAALRTATESLAISPLHRAERRQLRSYEESATPLDHAVRNVRILLRRTRAAVVDQEDIPPTLVPALRRLVRAIERLAETFEADPAAAREALVEDAAKLAADIHDAHAQAGFSTRVVLAQLRSVAVDLMQATGLSHDAARSALPRPES